MTAVFQWDQEMAAVGSAWIEKLKANAQAEPLRRARLNLHRSAEDPVQEMVIAFCAGSYNAPHRNLGGAKSWHALEGSASIILFNDDGSVRQRATISAHSYASTSLCRLSSSAWHTVIPIDPVVVLHEVALGPFRREVAMPAWVPSEETEIAKFIKRLS